jgi:hypothetical protein
LTLANRSFLVQDREIRETHNDFLFGSYLSKEHERSLWRSYRLEKEPPDQSLLSNCWPMPLNTTTSVSSRLADKEPGELLPKDPSTIKQSSLAMNMASDLSYVESEASDFASYYNPVTTQEDTHDSGPEEGSEIDTVQDIVPPILSEKSRHRFTSVSNSSSSSSGWSHNWQRKGLPSEDLRRPQLVTVNTTKDKSNREDEADTEHSTLVHDENVPAIPRGDTHDPQIQGHDQAPQPVHPQSLRPGSPHPLRSSPPRPLDQHGLIGANKEVEGRASNEEDAMYETLAIQDQAKGRAAKWLAAPSVSGYQSNFDTATFRKSDSDWGGFRSDVQTVDLALSARGEPEWYERGRIRDEFLKRAFNVVSTMHYEIRRLQTDPRMVQPVKDEEIRKQRLKGNWLLKELRTQTKYEVSALL